MGAARSGRRAVGGTRKSRLVDAQHLPSGDGARLFDWLELLDDPDDVLAAYGAFGHSVVVLDVLDILVFDLTLATGRNRGHRGNGGHRGMLSSLSSMSSMSSVST